VKRHFKLGLGILFSISIFAVVSCGGGGGGGGTTTASLSGMVTDASTGTGVPAVQVRAGGVSTTTDSAGAYTLDGVGTAASVPVTFDVAGYVPQARTTKALTTAGATVLINVPMLPVASEQSLAVPGTPATVSLAAGSLRTADGATATGTVTVQITPIAPASDSDVMPGNYMGGAPGAAAASIESFGALDVRFKDADGAALNLASGQSSTIRIPLSTRSVSPDATMPLFYFDTTTGLWVQEGTATLAGTAPNQYYEGTVTHFTTWNADQVTNTVTYTGCVVDVNDARVAGATVTSEGVNYTGKASEMTDANGDFTVSMKSGATAVIQSVKDTRVSNAVSVSSSTINITETTCLVLNQAAVSIKLTWGQSPSDLDSHTFGPTSADHVYYVNKGSLSAAPYLALDVDDVTSYGPEITTFSRLAQNSTYRFYVHNYSGTYSPGQTGSPAKVELNIGGIPRTFTPPAGESASTSDWHVFDLTTDANCQITVTTGAGFVTTTPTNPNSATTATFCE
jgi:uncharacterized protein YfaP (DUF2135 family)